MYRAEGKGYTASVLFMMAIGDGWQSNCTTRTVIRQWLLVSDISIYICAQESPRRYRSVSEGESHLLPTSLDNSAAELIDRHLWPLKNGYRRQGRCAAPISLIIILFLLAIFQSAILNHLLPLLRKSCLLWRLEWEKPGL